MVAASLIFIILYRIVIIPCSIYTTIYTYDLYHGPKIKNEGLPAAELEKTKEEIRLILICQFSIAVLGLVELISMAIYGICRSAFCSHETEVPIYELTQEDLNVA